METYKLRFFFDNFAGVCLWAGDIATMERFDYPVDLDMLPIPHNLTGVGGALIARWGLLLNPLRETRETVRERASMTRTAPSSGRTR